MGGLVVHIRTSVEMTVSTRRLENRRTRRKGEWENEEKRRTRERGEKENKRTRT